MARIAALEPPYADEVADQLTSMMPAGVPPIGLFRTFVKNLPMTRAMQPWGSYELGRDLSLSLRDREIVIDRTCARCGCEYEWGVHVAFFAERAGLDGAQVTSLTHGSLGRPVLGRRARPGADRRGGRAARAVRPLRRDVGPPRRGATEAECLDLLLLAGWYHAISYVARGARVDLEPGAPRFADVSRRCREVQLGSAAPGR